ncbi:signal recognition particle receptor subunit alpha, partial [Francisella tularensis subsp. holarctica]|uniref:signal recognition particle receptor subunit alpha n=1 Tax=Francisella tularensis TaxID=263 RepID=UPI002381A59D
MIFKKKKNKEIESPIYKVQEKDNKKGLLSRLQAGLSKTANKFVSGLSTILMGQKVFDEELLEEIEMQLLTADVGVEATD